MADEDGPLETLIRRTEEHGEALAADLEELSALQQELLGAGTDERHQIMLRLVWQAKAVLTRHIPRFRHDLTAGMHCLRELKADVRQRKVLEDTVSVLRAEVAAIRSEQETMWRVAKIVIGVATSLLAPLLGYVIQLVLPL